MKKEIAGRRTRADCLIHSGGSGAAVPERRGAKIRNLEEKKRRYEGILRRKPDGPDDEFETLRIFAGTDPSRSESRCVREQQRKSKIQRRGAAL